jgi:hypothetical protein
MNIVPPVVTPCRAEESAITGSTYLSCPSLLEWYVQAAGGGLLPLALALPPAPARAHRPGEVAHALPASAASGRRGHLRHT